ncbi:hypothetical protein [Streptomyces sp. NPDC059168]|uniref:hypothetical protein n=1 Tax=Streptomyces sp. NPDC059168 TaxID=3346753 RepID=UPI0036BBC903
MSDPEGAGDVGVLEAALAAAMRARTLDPDAEQRAVTHFRAALDAGARPLRTRRRDDWRPVEERRARRPVKVTFGVVFASLTLGGVAVAAIGSSGSPMDGARPGLGTERPSTPALDEPHDGATSASAGRTPRAGGSTPAQDTEAHCRAYQQVEDRGKAIDAAAWQQLVTAAGGKSRVATYCSEYLARTSTAPSRPAGAGVPGDGAAGADNGTGTAGNTGDWHSGTAGNSVGGTDNGAATGRTGAEPGGGKHK